MNRWYRWLVRLHSKEFRDEYGAELLETLARRNADRTTMSWRGRAAGHVREALALLRSSAKVRRAKSPVSLRSASRPASRRQGAALLLQDARYALRGFRTQPMFAAIVITTLALGIGANSAIFTLMDQVLLRYLPVEDPHELVQLDAPGRWRGWVLGDARFSHPFYRELREESDVFDGVLARYDDNLTLEHEGDTEIIDAVLVSGNYFAVLGVDAHVGRVLAPTDDMTPGAHAVAVLSHRYWQRRFGGDESVLGRTLRLNGHPMAIVGVSEPGFDGIDVGSAPDLFVPLMMKAQMTPSWDELDNRQVKFLHLVARLRPGSTRETTEAGANVTFQQISERDLAVMAPVSERFEEAFRNRRLELRSAVRGLSELREQFTTPLIVLMGMVGLVLLIACANVANLLLARSAVRQKEVALRLALGASRAQIVRQLLVESSLLALFGGAVAIAISAWTAEVLLRTLPFEGAAAAFSSRPDLRIALFTFAVSALTGVVFGLVPALQTTSRAQAGVLKEEGVLGALPQARFRRLLVVAQVALSLLLLIGAGLFTRSLYNLKSLDPGFQAERVLSFTIDPSLNGYSQYRVRTLFADIARELSALPGVASVSMAELPTMTDNRWMSTIRVEGYEPDEGENMNPDFNGVGPRYFETLGISLLSGREFTEGDGFETAKVAVINETMAKYFFGNDDPIGRRFGFGRDGEIDITIVGVVSDGKYWSLKQEPPRFGYVAYSQNDRLSTMTFYVRSVHDELSLVPSVRATLRHIDPSLPIYDVKTMRTQVAESMFLDRLVAGLSAAFGLVACLLAALGLYGVTSYMVTRRTREIGIRMALGAKRENVLGLVLREVAALASIGVVIGLPLGVALARFIESQLFQLSPWDPVSWAGASLTLLLVAFVSGCVPAVRASRVDPILALRWD